MDLLRTHCNGVSVAYLYADEKIISGDIVSNSHCMHIYIYIYIYINMHVCTYKYIYTHTLARTRIRAKMRRLFLVMLCE
jgi:hypothetical protein